MEVITNHNKTVFDVGTKILLKITNFIDFLRILTIAFRNIRQNRARVYLKAKPKLLN